MSAFVCVRVSVGYSTLKTCDHLTVTRAIFSENAFSVYLSCSPPYTKKKKKKNGLLIDRQIDPNARNPETQKSALR